MFGMRDVLKKEWIPAFAGMTSRHSVMTRME